MARKIKESKIKEMIYFYKNNNVSLQQVADKFNVSKATVWQYMRKNNIKIDAQRTKIGKKAWNSGLTKNTDSRVAKYAKTKSKDYILDGYKMTWSDKLNKSVREHHKVWFENTGIWPNTKIGEQIHHIDGDKLNNNFNNLVLCTAAEHTEIHKKYEQLVCKLIKNGIVKFNKKDNSLDIEYLEEFLDLKMELDYGSDRSW